MPEIEFTDNQVIIKIPKAVLVLTKAQFIEALRQGKAYRRHNEQRRRSNRIQTDEKGCQVPIVNGRGESSDNTAIKEEHLEVILQTWTRASKAILKRWNNYAYRTFFYLDLNSGSGLYSDIQDRNKPLEPLRGSPLIFLDAARDTALPCEVTLCERNKVAAVELRQNIVTRYQDARIDPNGDDDWDHRYYAGRYNLLQPVAFMDDFPIRSHLISASYDDIFDQFLARLMDVQGNRPTLCQPFGMVYSDENGTKQPWDFFREIAQRFPKIDILIHIGATGHKRSLSSPYVPRVDQPIDTIINSIDKTYWLVREPYTRQQWTFLLGTNWSSFPMFKKQGFWPHQSPQGKKFLYDVSVILHQEDHPINEGHEEVIV